VNQKADGAAERVLIVDDEEALAKVAARALRSRDIEADTAFSGAQARSALEQNAYSLVMLDVRLGDESGYELLTEIRKRWPDVAVVMVSGVDDPELGQAAIQHGAYAYLVKPVGNTELYLTAVNALRRRRLERDNIANLASLEAMVAERADQVRRAAAVQTGLLPSSPMQQFGYEVAAHFTPAREISGDFYDWYVPGPGRVAVTLGDVMGKGLPAAILMATVRAALRASSELGDVHEGVKLASKVIASALEANQSYVTLFHGVLDTETGELHYIDAGHGHTRLLRSSGKQESLPGERGAPLGIFPDDEYKPGLIVLWPGDTLVVFSDGLLDLRPDLATKDIPLPSEARNAGTVQELVNILAAGANATELADDVTVLALRRL
jgi:serine phosphatase RsbU (regulator of sigma subunit)